MPSVLKTLLPLVLLVLVSGCSGDEVQSTPEAAQYPEEIGTVEGVDSTVYRYDEGIYRGGDVVSQDGMNKLKDMGIKTIFSVTPTDDERAFAEKSGIKLVEVPFTKEGIPQEKLPGYLELLKDAEQPIYAHCHSGKNRGGTLLAAYRIHHQGWSFEKARDEFVALGGKDSEFPALMQSVKAN